MVATRGNVAGLTTSYPSALAQSDAFDPDSNSLTAVVIGNAVPFRAASNSYPVTAANQFAYSLGQPYWFVLQDSTKCNEPNFTYRLKPDILDPLNKWQAQDVSRQVGVIISITEKEDVTTWMEDVDNLDGHKTADAINSFVYNFSYENIPNFVDLVQVEVTPVFLVDGATQTFFGNVLKRMREFLDGPVVRGRRAAVARGPVKLVLVVSDIGLAATTLQGVVNASLGSMPGALDTVKFGIVVKNSPSYPTPDSMKPVTSQLMSPSQLAFGQPQGSYYTWVQAQPFLNAGFGIWMFATTADGVSEANTRHYLGPLAQVSVLATIAMENPHRHYHIRKARARQNAIRGATIALIVILCVLVMLFIVGASLIMTKSSLVKVKQ